MHSNITNGSTIWKVVPLEIVASLDTLILFKPIVEFLTCNALNFRETKILRYRCILHSYDSKC